MLTSSVYSCLPDFNLIKEVAMSLRNTVNSWLDGLAECVSLSRNLDEDGFLARRFGCESFHLFVPEEENYFVFLYTSCLFARYGTCGKRCFFSFFAPAASSGEFIAGC